MIDPADRILLVRVEFGDWTGWLLPGGGKEPGEDDATALKRELTEETGVPDVFMGPPVWYRRRMFTRNDNEFDGQEESVYLVPCHVFTIAPTMSAEELSSEGLVEHRWWTVADLETTDDNIHPVELASLAKQILEHGAPAEPPLIEE